MENNKNKKSVKFQGDMLNFCDFIQVFVFTRNHHLKTEKSEQTHSFSLSQYLNSSTASATKHLEAKTWARGYKTFFMLKSIVHEFFPTHEC